MNLYRPLLALSFVFSSAPSLRAVEAPADSSPMVAKVGDQVLTDAQMREELAFGLYEAEMNVYQTKKSWVDQKSRQIVFDKAAKEAKLSRKEWEKLEIESKLTLPTDAEIDQMAQNMSRGQMPTEPEKILALKNQARQYLSSQRRTMQENQVYGQLMQKYPVQVALLPPPQPTVQISFTKDNPSKGPKDAPVTILEFTDYECPWCARSQEPLKAAIKANEGKVKVVSRHYPLPMHSRAVPAAVAAVCAQEQGKFWPMHEKLFANQQALGDADFKRYAKDLGLNAGKFEKCLSSEKAAKQVQTDMQDGQRYGVRGTPTFFVNGQRANFNQLGEMIKAELEKKK